MKKTGKLLLRCGLTILIGFVLLLLIPIIVLWQPPPQATQTAVSRVDPVGFPRFQPPPYCFGQADPVIPGCNPTLIYSDWPISHQGSYAQGSVAVRGPKADDSFLAQHLDLGGVPISLNYSHTYPDEGMAIWTAPVGPAGTVVKIDHNTFSIIDIYDPKQREENPPDIPLGVTGAYSLLDNDNQFIVGRARSIELYADQRAGDRYSPITLRKRFELPDSFFCGDDDFLVGLNALFSDDKIVFVSHHGAVGVLPRFEFEMSAENLTSLQINDCEQNDLDLISNSIAVDETGGIFVVTSREVVRVQWDNGELSVGWRTTYKSTAEPLSPLRLGPGSGSTPSLMGNTNDRDKFVVITDGQELMHLVLLWRDEIPEDWEPIAPGADPRIACEVPIRFGDPNATQSLSEQSVLVYGYSTIHVNNLLRGERMWWQAAPPSLRTVFAAGAGGQPNLAPTGIERIDWNPETRTCETVWANTELSIPNGIPTMSSTSGLVYGIGQRDGIWGLEAVEFETGASRFFVGSRQERCSLAALQQVEPRSLRILTAYRVVQNPRVCENAFFAATQVGPDRTIYTGTFMGVSRFSSYDGQ